jgi:hypothetical protein
MEATLRRVYGESSRLVPTENGMDMAAITWRQPSELGPTERDQIVRTELGQLCPTGQLWGHQFGTIRGQNLGSDLVRGTRDRLPRRPPVALLRPKVRGCGNQLEFDRAIREVRQDGLSPGGKRSPPRKGRSSTGASGSFGNLEAGTLVGVGRWSSMSSSTKAMSDPSEATRHASVPII